VTRTRLQVGPIRFNFRQINPKYILTTSSDALPAKPSWWRFWPLITALALAGLVLWWLDAFAGLGQFALGHWQAFHGHFLGLVQSHPLLASVAVFTLHMLLAAFGLPGASVLMLLAGAGFGSFAGTLLCLTACTAGASLCMLTVRHFLRRKLQQKMGDRLLRLDRRIADDGAHYLFSLRVLPVIPFALVNVAVGLSQMNAWTFTWVSFVGMLAGTFVYVNAGSELAGIDAASDIYSPRVLISVAALALLPWLIKRLQNIWQARTGQRA
jgi:uncharacterized membrane protein YdjX (TVP38/TMEM64 family)